MQRKSEVERNGSAGGNSEPQTPGSVYYAPDDEEDGNTTPYGDTNGGIMNFIFRGGKTPPPEKPQGAGGPPAVVHLPQVPPTMKQTDFPISDREVTEVQVIKSLIDSYFRVVRKTFIDMVPKTIMFSLVNHVKDSLQNELVSELYREQEIMGLMKEAEDVAQKRSTCTEMRDLLSKALEIVNEVRDFNTFGQAE